MPDQGDWTVPTLTITPGDGTTSASLTVVAPDGTTSSPAVTTAHADGVATATGAGYELATAGEWVERWTVAGTGRSMQRNVVLVAPDPTATIVGVRIYATTTDYANWLLAAPPAGCRRALREASRVVDEMLLTAIYDTDTDGLPAQVDVAQGLKLAACAQAEHARARGDANTVGAGQVSSFQIGGIQVTKGTPAGQQPAPQLPAHWSPTAYDLLRQIPAEAIAWEPWSR